MGANFWSAGKNTPESTCTPNLKNVASSDTEILRGSQISFFPPCSLAPEPIRPKINRLRGTVEEYYGSEFQVIPIKRFLSRALTYKHTNIQTYIQSQNNIHAECTTCSAWIIINVYIPFLAISHISTTMQHVWTSHSHTSAMHICHQSV